MNAQLLTLSRLQFAFTVAFHMTFPAITVGLSLFLVFMYGAYLRTNQQIYLTIYRFWRNIFAVGFGIGVVAGREAQDVVHPRQRAVFVLADLRLLRLQLFEPGDQVRFGCNARAGRQRVNE